MPKKWDSTTSQRLAEEAPLSSARRSISASQRAAPVGEARAFRRAGESGLRRGPPFIALLEGATRFTGLRLFCDLYVTYVRIKRVPANRKDRTLVPFILVKRVVLRDRIELPTP